MKHRDAITKLLLLLVGLFGVLAFLCACEVIGPEGVPMEQAMCLRNRHAVVIVDGAENRRIYERDICPVHRRAYSINKKLDADSLQP